MFKNKDKELFNELTVVYFASDDFGEIKDMLRRSEINIERNWYKLIDAAEYILYHKNEKVAEIYLEQGNFRSNIYKSDDWQKTINLIYNKSKELYKKLYREEKENGTLTNVKKEVIKNILRL